MQGHRAVAAHRVDGVKHGSCLRGRRIGRTVPRVAVAGGDHHCRGCRFVHHHREGSKAETAVTVLTGNGIGVIRHWPYIDRIVAAIATAPCIIFGTGSGKPCGVTLANRGFAGNDNVRDRIHGDVNRILRRLLAYHILYGLGSRNGHHIGSRLRQSHGSQARVLLVGGEIRRAVPHIGKRVCIAFRRGLQVEKGVFAQRGVGHGRQRHRRRDHRHSHGVGVRDSTFHIIEGHGGRGNHDIIARMGSRRFHDARVLLVGGET